MTAVYKEILQYIETHIMDEINVTDIASVLGYSASHINKIFNTYSLFPIMDYIRRKKLYSAANELNTGRKLIDISLDYGYETPAGFYKAFKSVFGCSPTEYRNNFKNGGLNMQIFKEVKEHGHELVLFAHDKKLGLNAIIAIHSTILGPAFGGTRFWNYNSEGEALFDVLRLSKAMTFKCAAAGLKLGGGKAVIIGDPNILKSPEFFYAYGKFVDSLGGRYYTANDVNISTTDILQINKATPYVTGLPSVGGNPSPFTARGVLMGMKAGASVVFGTDSLKDKTVAVLGLGSVGYNLCEMLHNEGARLKVFELNPDTATKAVQQFGAEAIATGDAFMSTECDILAPCAMGAVLNTKNVKKLKCKLVAGASNNILFDAATGDALQMMDILYLPDYIINAGGVINNSMEFLEGTYNLEAVNKKVDAIYETTLKIIALAKEKGINTLKAADNYAEGIINSV